MPHISFLIAAAMANDSDPTTPKESPLFDERIHKRAGTLPIELRRVFELLQKMAEQSTPQDLQMLQNFDSALTKGHVILHKSIAEIYHLQPLDEVVICQDWVVAVEKSWAVPNINTSLPPVTKTWSADPVVCSDKASY